MNNNGYQVFERPPSRAIVLEPHLKAGNGSRAGRREPEARLEEAVGLTAAINLDVAHAEVVRLKVFRPGTLFGGGKVEGVAKLVETEGIDVVIVDSAVSPVQQRNLERAWKTKVIDRTSLILEIFGERARTREGRMQVELAHLTYQRSRLVRSWTHLERQRGGLGFVGGPGESQLEIDRRLNDERVAKIKRELQTVARTRELHRASRRKVPYPVVALVGYTNAGKSTLFNYLTSSKVLAEDMLFATLDPTMRELTLPGGRRIILSDTVGFISELPTHLVAAFRATLEEVVGADLIVHVRDISHPESDAQAADVREVLGGLGIDDSAQGEMIEAYNKIDLLDADSRHNLGAVCSRSGGREVAISAVDGSGCDQLLATIETALGATREVVEVTVSPQDGATLAWLYRHGEILVREDKDDGAHLKVSLDASALGRLQKKVQVSRRIG